MLTAAGTEVVAKVEMAEVEVRMKVAEVVPAPVKEIGAVSAAAEAEVPAT